MVLVSVRYGFSQRFSVPAKEAYGWCTDYSPSDHKLMGHDAKRAVTRLSDDAILLKDVYPGEHPVRKTKLVRLNPERMSFTATHLTGPTRYSQFWYEIHPEGERRSRLDFTGLLVYRSKARPTAREVSEVAERETKDDSKSWVALAKAMESELSRSRR